MAARSSPRARRRRSWPTRTRITGQYLSGELDDRRAGEAPRASRRRAQLTVVGARGNNLKNVTASIPLGTFTCVTGVSGGGKSTLLIETLYKAVVAPAQRRARAPGRRTTASTGLEFLDKVIDIDQSPIGRTPRSNPATYTGAFTPIRDWFAGLPEAKARGYQPGRFSFNVKGGRCEACQGDGVIKIEMHFLPDVYVTCDVCKGKRYNRETLEVVFKGKSIADVLDMTVEEGVDFFAAVPGDPRQAGDADAGRPRLHPHRPAGDDAVRRRGAARQARQGTVASAPPAARSTSSTSRPPACISTTWRSSWKCCTSWSTRATRWSSSSTISKSSRPPTGSSTSAPKAATAAAKSSPPARPEDIAKEKRSYTGPVPEGTAGRAAREAKARSGGMSGKASCRSAQ